MKLSVLMPVYNERRTLREIVRRVLAQSVNGVDKLELVIVDDCSNDGSADIIRQRHYFMIKAKYRWCGLRPEDRNSIFTLDTNSQVIIAVAVEVGAGEITYGAALGLLEDYGIAMVIIGS